MRPRHFLAILACLAAVPALGQDGAGQPFRIFFDWSKPELSRDGEAALGDVVAAYQKQKPSRILIAGHADRSGSAASNLAASRRRAEAVSDYLQAHGVPAGALSVTAHGETQPLVATEDGVREVQNRRVEIRFADHS